MKKGTYIKVTKLLDEKFNGEHPNGINEGYVTVGYIMDDIQVGKPLEIESIFTWFRTSDIIEIISDNTIRTKNSVYLLEKIVDPILDNLSTNKSLDELPN